MEDSKFNNWKDVVKGRLLTVVHTTGSNSGGYQLDRRILIQPFTAPLRLPHQLLLSPAFVRSFILNSTFLRNCKTMFYHFKAATLFKAGSSTVACRRRRQLEEPFIDNDVIAPSHVEK